MDLKAKKEAGKVEEQKKATEEQIAYAEVLNRGMKIGLVVLVATFLIYVTGMLKPHVPLGDVSKYWSMPVGEYLTATDVHAGWSWLGMLSRGDYLNFAGIAFLGSVTIFCYMVIVPILLRKKDKIYAVLAAVEVLILTLAASGLLKVGGH